MQAATLPIEVATAVFAQEELDAWEGEPLPSGEGRLPPEKAQRLQMLVLKAVLMANGLKIVWPGCTREGSVWETGPYLRRMQHVEFLARVVVDVLTRTQEIVARTRATHPEWVAPREMAEVQSNLPAAQEILAQVQKLLAWLNRPRPPANEEMIRRSQESLSRGEGELLGDIIARLKDGGPQ
jgi:hypothetical protein